MGTAAASAGAAGPFQGLLAGRSSGRTEAGVHRGERTTRPRDYESGPTRQSDDLDSEPDYLLRPTRHGPGGSMLDYSAFLLRAPAAAVTENTVGTSHSKDISVTPTSEELDVTFESAIKEAAAFAASPF